MKTRDRKLDPEESGHTKPLAYGPGQVGEVIGFIRRRLQGYEFPMAVVRWDAQLWYEWDIPLNQMEEGKVYGGDDLNRMYEAKGPRVDLPPLELPAHPEALEPL